MSNALINWLEIPVVDMKRAVQFYETVFDTQLRRETIGDVDLAVFPNQGPAGALVAGERYRSSAFYGPVPYLHAPGLDAILKRVAYAGGRTVHGPMQLPEAKGRYAHITDSEGNRIGLHEPVAG